MFAVIAIVGVFSARDIPTIVARFAAPIIQTNIWTIRVVTVQYASDHCEEIAQAALFEGNPDRDSPITFAQLLVADVRVGNAFVCCCRMWIQRRHKIRARPVQFTQLIQLKFNSERPEVYTIQFDRVCLDGNTVVLSVKVYAAKFLL